jgi:hypothetical protein
MLSIVTIAVSASVILTVPVPAVLTDALLVGPAKAATKVRGPVTRVSGVAATLSDCDEPAAAPAENEIGVEEYEELAAN